ncbi:MAG: phosphoribosylglycinamide formyltransferase-1 [Pseudohongiellaceae bacterium]|jgi:phosphoribosylglycinamide formyltransferase-1
MTVKLAVLLSGGGRTLLNLHEAIVAGQLDASVTVVISSLRTAKGLLRAAECGFETMVLRPRDYEDSAAFARAQAQAIQDSEADLVVMAGYLVHFPVPQGWEQRIVNIHPSLLPRHGGKGLFGNRVHASVLTAGDPSSGCTVHVVDDQYDHGPVLAQTEVPVLPDDNVDTLAARVFDAECRTYPAAIRAHAQSLGLL